jgi:hypothetical protein
VGKPEGNRPLGRTRRRWEDNIKVDLKISLGKAWARLIWLLIGQGASCCAGGSELGVQSNAGNSFTKWAIKTFKKDSEPCSWLVSLFVNQSRTKPKFS